MSEFGLINWLLISIFSYWYCYFFINLKKFPIECPPAPISAIFINTDPSGLIRCSTKEVYPAPVVQWSTKPSLPPAALQPITHMAPGGKGLFTVESILKQQNKSLDHIYVCNITSKYGTQSWTASLKLQGKTSDICFSTNTDICYKCYAYEGDNSNVVSCTKQKLPALKGKTWLFHVELPRTFSPSLSSGLLRQ